MGYDCYVRTASGADHDNDEHYFRRSIFGGSPLADALIALGMGFEAETFAPIPLFPDADEYGVEWHEWKDETGKWHDGYIGERATEYEAEVNRVLDWHGPEIPGIPVHKICTTNDGWHVTRAECDAALHLYESAIRDGKPHPEAFRDDFVPFLRCGAQHDGFEVH